MEEEFNSILESQDGTEETTKTEIVEDMPNFEENTAEKPCESAESVDNQSADTESAILSEEKTEESAPSAEKKEETEERDDSFYKWNPLQMAIKPFYDKAIAEDALFAKEVAEKESRAEKPKSLAECAEYIMGEAYRYAMEHKFGSFGFAGIPDEDMPSLIKHYYDEDDIKIHKIGAGVQSSVSRIPSAPTAPVKGKGKGKEKPKATKNVVDITKAIMGATEGKQAVKKDNLKAGFVPMERPDTLKDARKGSKEQAKSVETIDMFADFFANEGKD